MVTCEICKGEFKNLNGLSKHILKHNINSEEYYLKFIGKKEVCKECNGKTKFKSLVHGYQKFCSSKCCNGDLEKTKLVSNMRKDWWKNSKKVEKTKEKIKNTVSNLWKDKNSIFNSQEYRKNLSNGLLHRWEIWREKEFIHLCKSYGFKPIDNYEDAHEKMSFECLNCKRKFKTIWNYLQSGKNCPYCYPSGYSKQEEEIYNFIFDIAKEFKIIRNSKTIIPPKELDIYLPEKNISIEYNGLWTHSANCKWGKKGRNYHLQKTIDCQKNGIRLIHIFEDEWLFKQDIVKDRLTHILGLSNKQKIYAKQCLVKEIDSKEKNLFLSKYHLQGQDTCQVKLGAFYNNELVSVMTFSKGKISKGAKPKKGIWELSRFCSTDKYNVIGIAGKLLKYFKVNFLWYEIFSYADNRWSIGNLYYKLGFDLEKITSPNYWYIKDYKRIHRFSLRKPSNIKDITEFQLRLSQGYDWIWDCGNYKFSMTNLEVKVDGY